VEMKSSWCCDEKAITQLPVMSRERQLTEGVVAFSSATMTPGAVEVVAAQTCKAMIQIAIMQL
jgi:hypothetical protein